jgi:ketosteroid isomerase-like protein
MQEATLLIETAPAAITRFMDAAARRDYEALAACFAEDPTVSDEERTHRGRNEIRQWQKDTRAQWDYTVTVVGGEVAGADEYLLAVHLQGNFPGGEADVNYRFTMRGDLIARLVVEPG